MLLNNLAFPLVHLRSLQTPSCRVPRAPAWDLDGLRLATASHFSYRVSAFDVLPLVESHPIHTCRRLLRARQLHPQPRALSG